MNPTDTQTNDGGWRPISEAPAPGTEILGYNPDWVDEEFSPGGIRSCIHDGQIWHSSTWRDDDEILKHSFDAPTHFRALPAPPKEEAP